MKTTAKKLSALLLLLCLLFSMISVPATAAGVTSYFDEDVLKSAIEEALPSAADELQAYLDELRASGDILTDALGNPLDMDEVFSAYETNIAILRNGALNLDYTKLISVNYLYYGYYIKDFVNMADVAEEIAFLMGFNFYLDRLDEGDLANAAWIRCYQSVIGDQFGYYYTDEELASQDETTSYVGIGVSVLSWEGGYAEVVQVFHNSSAEEAGILPGDIIIAVNGEDFAKIGYNEAIDLIRGEEGTTVDISVRRGDEILHFTIERRQTLSYSIIYKTIESEKGKIGYVMISTFNETTFLQFCEAIEELEAEGVSSYIFDVRGNSGGMMTSVLGILDYILPDDTNIPLLRLQYGDGTSRTIYSINDYMPGAYQNGFEKAMNHSLDKPMAVLCNENSASAAELFVSCLQDFEYAEIIGETTYGKGVGQSAYSFTSGGQLLLTTFYYAPPLSENYHEVGVTPDRTVSLSEEAKATNIFLLAYENDAQLQAAVSYIESVDPSAPPTIPHAPDEKNGATIVLWVLLGVLSVMLIAVIVLLFFFFKRGKRESEDTLFSTQKRSDGSDMFHS